MNRTINCCTVCKTLDTYIEISSEKGIEFVCFDCFYKLSGQTPKDLKGKWVDRTTSKVPLEKKCCECNKVVWSHKQEDLKRVYFNISDWYSLFFCSDCIKKYLGKYWYNKLVERKIR